MSAAVELRRSSPDARALHSRRLPGFDVPLDSEIIRHRQPHPPAARHRLRRTPPRHSLGTPAAPQDGRLSIGADSGVGLGRSRRSRSPSTPSGRWASRVATWRASRQRSAGVSTPKLSLGWLTLRATRLPFLSATFIPVIMGIAIAAVHGSFDLVCGVVDGGRRGRRPPRAQRRQRRVRRAPRAQTSAMSIPRSSVAGRASSSTGSSRCGAWAPISAGLYAVAIGVGLVLLADAVLGRVAGHRRSRRYCSASSTRRRR